MKIKELFCNHKYKVAGSIPFTYQIDSTKFPADATFLECLLCKKRITLMQDKSYYGKGILKLINLWKKHQLEIDFESFKKVKDEVNNE